MNDKSDDTEKEGSVAGATNAAIGFLPRKYRYIKMRFNQQQNKQVKP